LLGVIVIVTVLVPFPVVLTEAFVAVTVLLLILTTPVGLLFIICMPRVLAEVKNPVTVKFDEPFAETAAPVKCVP
jgi:hypothetical protein